MVRHLRFPCGALLLALAACGDDGAAATSGNATTPAPPAGATATVGSTMGPSATSGGPVVCAASSPQASPPCYCAADHVAGTTTPPVEGVCRDACIAGGVVSLWCLDDAGCCSGTCDEATGYCTDGGATTGTVTSTGTSGATGGSDTGTSGP